MKNLLLLCLFALFIISCDSPMDINQQDFDQVTSKAIFKSEFYLAQGSCQVGYDSGKIGTDMVNLEWTISTEKDFHVYKLYRNDDLIGTWDDPQVNACRDTLLQMDTIYEYKLVTFRKNLMSETDIMTVKTANWQEPSELTINGLDTNLVALTWTDRADLEKSILLIREESVNSYSFSTIDTLTLAANTITYQWSNLEDNMYYRYGLKYVNTDMPELNTIFSSSFSSADFVLNTPVNLSAVCNSDMKIDLSWTDNSTLETAFFIERAKNLRYFVQIAQVEMNTTTYTDEDTLAYALGDTLYYRIRAFNSYSGEYSDYSEIASVIVSEITNLQITITVHCDSYPSEASWNVRNEQTGQNIFAYDKTFSSSGQIQTEVLMLEPGSYSVRCYDSYGDGGIEGIVINQQNDVLVSWDNNDYGSFGNFNFTVSR
ncbi:MAG: hypothetical protein PHR06_00730 [Candidatus Cloacimonetes bacterium]|nr:hypothetical protein [Candidatus Cloacimonadota bacterium]